MMVKCKNLSLKKICFHLSLFKQDIHSFCKLEIRQLFCSHLGDKLIFYLLSFCIIKNKLTFHCLTLVAMHCVNIKIDIKGQILLLKIVGSVKMLSYWQL